MRIYPMAQPKSIQTDLTASSQFKPLLLLNDEQRRRRHEAKLRNQSRSPTKSPTKSYIKNHQLIENNVNGSPQYKSMSQQYTTDKLLKPISKPRMHSKSGPPRYKKKKRTFKLSEPPDLINHNAPPLKKKVSRVFIRKEINVNLESSQSSPLGCPDLSRSISYSPSVTPPYTAPILSSTSSAPIYSDTSPLSSTGTPSPHYNYSNSKKKRSSFKLGDDSSILPFKFSAAASFSSYQTKYKVHKPRIKPGSNQFLVNDKMRELQAKLKREQRENEMIDGVQHSFGQSLKVLKSIKLPNYTGKIPLILIELKKKLHGVDGLKQKNIFDVSLLDGDAYIYTSISMHHRIAKLIRSFFLKLPMKLLDNVSINTYLSKINHFKEIPDIIKKIPDPNKSVLLWLWDLLSDTIEYQRENKMNYDSLSKSMAPIMTTNNKYNDLFIIFFKYGIQWRLYLRESNY